LFRDEETGSAASEEALSCVAQDEAMSRNIPARHHEVDEKLGRPSLHRRYEDAGRDQEGEKNNRRAEA
jgi:hypothetical protein